MDGAEGTQHGDLEHDVVQLVRGEGREAGIVERGVDGVLADREPQRLMADDVPDASAEVTLEVQGHERSAGLEKGTGRRIEHRIGRTGETRCEDASGEIEEQTPFIAVERPGHGPPPHRWYRESVIARLPRGRGDIRLDLRGLRVRPLEPGAPAVPEDVAKTVADALDRPRHGPPLTEIARERRDAVIVVPDATRRADLPMVLPIMLHRLRDAGIADPAITVLVACGTHPRVDAARLDELVGSLPSAVTVVQHDARAEDMLVECRRGGDAVRLNRIAVEASLLVTVSSVRHHYFAGFGGGPKMLFPGLGGYAQIQSNHARVMRRDADGPTRDPRCEPGVLAGNPVAEEISRLASIRPPDAALCTVPARDGHVAWASFGEPSTVFAEAVDQVRAWYESPHEGPFDVMVVSAGGYPADHTLIQAHKALDAASRFLHPGGEMLFVAELGGGGGSPDIEPFLRHPEPAEIMARLDETWVQYGHTVLRLVDKTARFRVWLHSELDPAVAERLGFAPVRDAAEVVTRWRQDGRRRTVGVMTGEPVYPSTTTVGG